MFEPIAKTIAFTIGAGTGGAGSGSGGGGGNLWVWADGDQHAWADGTDATWVDEGAVANTMLFESGVEALWEDSPTIDWEQ